MEKIGSVATLVLAGGIMMKGDGPERSTSDGSATLNIGESENTLIPSEHFAGREATDTSMLKSDESAIREAQPKTPLKSEQGNNIEKKTESPESDRNKSTDSSEGHTTHERGSSVDFSGNSKNGDSVTTESSQKKSVSFPSEVIAADELKRNAEMRGHISTISNPAEYRAKATAARKANDKSAKYWDKAFLHAQRYNQAHPNFSEAIKAKNEDLITLWGNILNHAQECMNNYIQAAENLSKGDDTYASILDGKASSFEDILDHHIKTAKYATEADAIRTTDHDELSHLFQQASQCSSQAAATRTPYEKQLSELWSQASNYFVKSAEACRKTEEALDEGAPDEADLWTQASHKFRESANASANAATAFANGDKKEANCLKREAWNRSYSMHPAKIAIIDTGIRYTHEDLTNNMCREELTKSDLEAIQHDRDHHVSLFPDFTEENLHTMYYGYNAYRKNTNVIDLHGHGTHCAGIIGAEEKASEAAKASRDISDDEKSSELDGTKPSGRKNFPWDSLKSIGRYFKGGKK